MSLRAAILPPAPAAYREPLFGALAARPGIELRVIYQAAAAARWDAAPGFFPATHSHPAEHLRARQRARPGRSPVVWPVGLEAALDGFDPDVVVAVEYGFGSLRALRWARTHRRGFVILSDCTPAIDPLLSRPQLALHRALARHADRMIVVSRAGRARLRGFGVAESRIVLAPQSGDLAPIRAAVAAAPPLPEPPPLRLLSAGRLVADKNLSTLVAAIAELPAGSVALSVAGTGPLAESLGAQAARRGVTLNLLGAIAPAAMPAVYAAAHAFALVSTFEPFGVVVREALAAGLPILCSDRAGAAGEVARDGENALLVDPDDVAAITAALRILAEDPDRRAALAAASRRLDAADPDADVDGFERAITEAAVVRGRLDY